MSITLSSHIDSSVSGGTVYAVCFTQSKFTDAANVQSPDRAAVIRYVVDNREVVDSGVVQLSSASSGNYTHAGGGEELFTGVLARESVDVNSTTSTPIDFYLPFHYVYIVTQHGDYTNAFQVKYVEVNLPHRMISVPDDGTVLQLVGVPESYRSYSTSEKTISKVDVTLTRSSGFVHNGLSGLTPQEIIDSGMTTLSNFVNVLNGIVLNNYGDIPTESPVKFTIEPGSLNENNGFYIESDYVPVTRVDSDGNTYTLNTYDRTLEVLTNDKDNYVQWGSSALNTKLFTLVPTEPVSRVNFFYYKPTLGFGVRLDITYSDATTFMYTNNTPPDFDIKVIGGVMYDYGDFYTESFLTGSYITYGDPRNTSRLDAVNNWSLSIGDWVTLDLGEVRTVSGVATIGGSGEYVTKINVETSIDGSEWTERLTNVPANQDDNTLVDIFFPQGNIDAQYVKITPLEFIGSPSMRVDAWAYAHPPATVPNLTTQRMLTVTDSAKYSDSSRLTGCKPIKEITISYIQSSSSGWNSLIGVVLNRSSDTNLLTDPYPYTIKPGSINKKNGFVIMNNELLPGEFQNTIGNEESDALVTGVLTSANHPTNAYLLWGSFATETKLFTIVPSQQNEYHSSNYMTAFDRVNVFFTNKNMAFGVKFEITYVDDTTSIYYNNSQIEPKLLIHDTYPLHTIEDVHANGCYLSYDETKKMTVEHVFELDQPYMTTGIHIMGVDKSAMYETSVIDLIETSVDGTTWDPLHTQNSHFSPNPYYQVNSFFKNGKTSAKFVRTRIITHSNKDKLKVGVWVFQPPLLDVSESNRSYSTDDKKMTRIEVFLTENASSYMDESYTNRLNGIVVNQKGSSPIENPVSYEIRSINTNNIGFNDPRGTVGASAIEEYITIYQGSDITANDLDIELKNILSSQSGNAWVSWKNDEINNSLFVLIPNVPVDQIHLFFEQPHSAFGIRLHITLEDGSTVTHTNNSLANDTRVFALYHPTNYTLSYYENTYISYKIPSVYTRSALHDDVCWSSNVNDVLTIDLEKETNVKGIIVSKDSACDGYITHMDVRYATFDHTWSSLVTNHELVYDANDNAYIFFDSNVLASYMDIKPTAIFGNVGGMRTDVIEWNLALQFPISTTSVLTYDNYRSGYQIPAQIKTITDIKVSITNNSSFGFNVLNGLVLKDFSKVFDHMGSYAEDAGENNIRDINMYGVVPYTIKTDSFVKRSVVFVNENQSYVYEPPLPTNYKATFDIINSFYTNTNNFVSPSVGPSQTYNIRRVGSSSIQELAPIYKFGSVEYKTGDSSEWSDRIYINLGTYSSAIREEVITLFDTMLAEFHTSSRENSKDSWERIDYLYDTYTSTPPVEVSQQKWNSMSGRYDTTVFPVYKFGDVVYKVGSDSEWSDRSYVGGGFYVSAVRNEVIALFDTMLSSFYEDPDVDIVSVFPSSHWEDMLLDTLSDYASNSYVVWSKQSKEYPLFTIIPSAKCNGVELMFRRPEFMFGVRLDITYEDGSVSTWLDNTMTYNGPTLTSAMPSINPYLMGPAEPIPFFSEIIKHQESIDNGSIMQYNPQSWTYVYDFLNDTYARGISIIYKYGVDLQKVQISVDELHWTEEFTNIIINEFDTRKTDIEFTNGPVNVRYVRIQLVGDSYDTYDTMNVRLIRYDPIINKQNFGYTTL